MSQLTDRIDARIDGLSMRLRQAQSDHIGRRGIYFQGPKTPTVEPVDGAQRVVDRDAKVPGKPESWRDFIGTDLPVALDFSIEIHEYVGPKGPGWLLITSLVEGSARICRIRDFGLEGRDVDWFNTDSEVIPAAPLTTRAMEAVRVAWAKTLDLFGRA